MRQYKVQTENVKELDKIVCNKCGKEIVITRGVPQEDFLEVEKRWGYHSHKDNEVDSFELCEDCYDALLSSFQIKIRN